MARTGSSFEPDYLQSHNSERARRAILGARARTTTRRRSLGVWPLVPKRQTRVEVEELEALSGYRKADALAGTNGMSRFDVAVSLKPTSRVVGAGTGPEVARGARLELASKRPVGRPLHGLHSRSPVAQQSLRGFTP